MECFCHLRNIQDELADRESAYERRFGTSFDDPLIPFGAEIHVNPISTKDKSRLHQLGTKIFPGLFIRYALNSGGGWIEPHGELFFFILKKEPMVLSELVEFGPCFSAETVKSCALIGLHLIGQASTSHIETRKDVGQVRPSMSRCAQQKAKQQWDDEKHEYKLHVRRGTFTISFPTKKRIRRHYSERQKDVGDSSGTSDHQSSKVFFSETVGELADACASMFFYRSTRHLVDSQCVSPSCHDMDQSASQKVGETDKFSQMHCG